MQETIESFFQSRNGWMDVRVQESKSGYDVVVRLDGAYLRREDAEVNAAMFAQRLAILGLGS
jgi:hypothetical protein